MTRVAGNWLQTYRQYTSEQEAPDSFHFWTGLSILASAVRRNVYLDQGVYWLYPNLYVILVAPAGKIGKSTVIRMGREILQSVPGIVMGPDSITREELIRFMAKAGKDSTQSAVTIHSTELSSLIDESGLRMVQFLTDIYDCDYKNPAGWRYSTKTQGKDTIKNPVLNLLAGTIPNWVSDSMPVEATTHGFTSRTIFVFEDRPRKSNPFPDAPDESLIDALQADLKHIAQIEGVFAWSDEAKDWYKEWYGEWQTSAPRDYRIEGYHWRKRTHILKVGMLLAISDRDDLILTKRDLQAAEAVMLSAERKMPRAFSGVGKFEYASDLERIYHQVTHAGGMPVADIFNRNYMVGDRDQIWKIVKTLEAMNRIKLQKVDGERWATPVEARRGPLEA